MAQRVRDTLQGSPRWFDYINNSSEVIPAGAVLRVSSAAAHTSQGQTRPAYTVAKPDAVGAQFRHAINDLDRVPAGGYGRCTFEGPVLALYDDAGGTPGLGEAWGPNNNSWKLTKRIGGFVIDQTSTNGTTLTLVTVRFAPWLYCYGNLDGDLAHAGSATLSVYDSSGDTTYNVTVYDPSKIGSGKEIVSGSRIDAVWSTQDNRWTLNTSAVCPTTA